MSTKAKEPMLFAAWAFFITLCAIVSPLGTGAVLAFAIFALVLQRVIASGVAIGIGRAKQKGGAR